MSEQVKQSYDTIDESAWPLLKSERSWGQRELWIVLLVAAFGLGLLILLYWYIKTRATALTVTEHELLYEKGILSKERLAVSLRHVRAIQVNQSFVNRILGVGTTRRAGKQEAKQSFLIPSDKFVERSGSACQRRFHQLFIA